MPIELKVEEQLEVPDGDKKGQITKVEERLEPYHYIDVYVTCDGYDIPELKAGFPAAIRPNTKLGKTLKNFIDLEKVMGEKVDLEKILVGQKVTYLTMMEETPKGRFVRIVDGSIKPLPNQPTPETDAAKKELADNAATIKKSE